jgi:hypothetical protein
MLLGMVYIEDFHATPPGRYRDKKHQKMRDLEIYSINFQRVIEKKSIGK